MKLSRRVGKTTGNALVGRLGNTSQAQQIPLKNLARAMIGQGLLPSRASIPGSGSSIDYLATVLAGGAGIQTCGRLGESVSCQSNFGPISGSVDLILDCGRLHA